MTDNAVAINIRANADDVASWKLAAKEDERSMAGWIRFQLNKACGTDRGDPVSHTEEN